MKLITAIKRTSKLDEVKDALERIQAPGMTVMEVRGHGRQNRHTAIYRGREYEVSLLPKMQLDVEACRIRTGEREVAGSLASV